MGTSASSTMRRYSLTEEEGMEGGRDQERVGMWSSPSAVLSMSKVALVPS